MSNTNIADFYPLSPMQQGMLFDSLFNAESAVYTKQWQATLKGNLHIDAFGKAWKAVIDRHPILRTAFLWEKVRSPIQIVYTDCDLPLKVMDWRNMPDDEQIIRLNELLEEDRNAGFVLSRPSLMRLTAVRCSSNTTQFVWSHHHIILDGWSAAQIVREVFAHYDAIRTDHALTLAKPRPFRDYIVWLHQQDTAAAEHHWRETLLGFYEATPIGIGSRPETDREAIGPEEAGYHLVVPDTVISEAHKLSKQAGCTLSTVIHAAWALLLSLNANRDDVLFGALIAVRPENLPGIDDMAGVFINNVPIRIKIEAKASLKTWLHGLFLQQAKTRDFAYSSSAQIRAWSDVSGENPLFESLIVFQNYPNSALTTADGSLSASRVRDHELVKTPYALTLFVNPGSEFGLHFTYRTDRFPDTTIQRMASQLLGILFEMGARPETVLSRILSAVEPDWKNTRFAVSRDHHVKDKNDLARVTIEEVTDQRHIPPQTEIERKLVTAWKEVLQLERVGIHDNFFDIGGHSFRMFQLRNHLKDLFQIDFSMVDLFRYPNIHTLAQHIGCQMDSSTSADQERGRRRRQAVRRRNLKQKLSS